MQTKRTKDPGRPLAGVRIAFATLGCRVNQYETDAAVTSVHAAGAEVVDEDGAPDVYVLNTCTVTGKSDRKSRQLVLRALARRPDAFIVVTGCYVESGRTWLDELGPRVVALDNARKHGLADLVAAHLAGRGADPGLVHPDPFGFAAADDGLSTRSRLKIQDGCDNFCSYCIVPHVRGRAASRPAVAVLAEAERLVAAGYRELVLTGVNIGRWRDGEQSLAALVESLVGLPGDFRVRLSSLEPEGLDERFAALLAHPKLCPHLHLALQSGSDRVLAAMGRRYDAAGFRSLVARLRAAAPALNLTTDVIAGFPGESDEEFAATLRLVDEIGFGHVHAFRYSARPGTPAATMPGQLPERVKAERGDRLRALAAATKRRYRAGLVGRRQRVLVETLDGDGTARGYGELFVPVRFPGPAAPNTFADVRLAGLADGDDPDLLGEPAAADRAP